MELSMQSSKSNPIIFSSFFSIDIYRFLDFAGTFFSRFDFNRREGHKRLSESEKNGKERAGARKAKKKQVKDELDRIKQAEKKKRRLEKALATSAAIRSELEKKKLKMKEEQERLDEEGAAIAEAVALHVLLGEDSDDSCKVMLKKDEELTSLDNDINFNFVIGGRHAMVPHDDLSNYLLEGSGWASDPNGYRCMWNPWDNSNLIVPSGPLGCFITSNH
ncbi:unnamed protein product [Fraxinus pennsylvanica]|uniref:Uncharacterized protein n=1 Tax=Fraxinus pennsylvanica TaxID=56036 RepID=A0AAD1ZLF5_9LAMI|nr:unnamed protein product [Fraxinus pennsylvanica]